MEVKEALTLDQSTVSRFRLSPKAKCVNREPAWFSADGVTLFSSERLAWWLPWKRGLRVSKAFGTRFCRDPGPTLRATSLTVSAGLFEPQRTGATEVKAAIYMFTGQTMRGVASYHNICSMLLEAY